MPEEKRKKRVKKNTKKEINKNNAKKINKKKFKEIIKSKINKQNLFYLLMAIIDISFIIYCAKHNIANYVKVEGEGTFYIGDSKDLLFGKNYITIIFTMFIYIYLLLSNKIFFNIKQSKRNILRLLILLLLLNMFLFFVFTERIY